MTGGIFELKSGICAHNDAGIVSIWKPDHCSSTHFKPSSCTKLCRREGAVVVGSRSCPETPTVSFSGQSATRSEPHKGRQVMQKLLRKLHPALILSLHLIECFFWSCLSGYSKCFEGQILWSFEPRDRICQSFIQNCACLKWQYRKRCWWKKSEPW